ncbi:hypothetical protein GCM10027612_55530 [Microbispora bryophytorum subsp. camponoti]
MTAKVALGEAALPVTVTADGLVSYLGRPRHVPESSLPEARQRTGVPGVATGLAVTGAGATSSTSRRRWPTRRPGRPV